MSVDLYRQRSWLEVMVPAAELAKQIANTEFVPKGMRGNAGAIAAAILFGDEVGIGPMQSLARIAVIEGKPALSAEAQRALILRAGHAIWIEEATTTKVTMCGQRRDSEHVSRVTWTMDDAKRANLAGRPSWRMYPRQMLTARATAELARAVFADAIGGLAAIEELEDPAGELGELPSGNGAETATRRRKRKDTALMPAASSGPEPEAPVGPPLPGEVVEEPSPFQPPELAIVEDQTKPTTRQLKNLNRLVGTLREEGAIQTEHLWSSLANKRGLHKDEMIELLGGLDDEAVLHWSPLRDSLDRDEASNLIDRLQRLEENMGEVAAVIRCKLCGREVTEVRSVYREVVGWERPSRGISGVSGSSLEAREHTGEVAHANCVHLKRLGVSTEQAALL